MQRLPAMLVMAYCASAGAAEISPVEVMRTTFAPEVELQHAVSAAPAHLRAAATVYVYGANGYEVARTGTNGITCLLNRDAFIYGARAFKPTCWDIVGTTTYVPVMLKVGELLANGQSPDAIRAAIDTGFASGTFQAPTRGGVAYMLAGDIELDLKSGQMLRQVFPGHYMFYALGATTAQLGVTAAALSRDPTLPTVFAGGAGGAHGLAYLIAVPGGAPAASQDHPAH